VFYGKVADLSGNRFVFEETYILIFPYSEIIRCLY